MLLDTLKITTMKSGEDRSALRYMQCAVFPTSEKAHGSFCSGDKQQQQQEY